MRHYDVVIIGTGPAGQKAAIQAAKLGKRVAAVEKCSTVRGAQINTGTGLGRFPSRWSGRRVAEGGIRF